MSYWTVIVFEVVLPLLAASAAELAGTRIVTLPVAEADMSAVYDEPLPLSALTVPLVTTKSEVVKPETDSLKVICTVIGSEFVGLGVSNESEHVGALVSMII